MSDASQNSFSSTYLKSLLFQGAGLVLVCYHVPKLFNEINDSVAMGSNGTGIVFGIGFVIYGLRLKYLAVKNKQVTA